MIWKDFSSEIQIYCVFNALWTKRQRSCFVLKAKTSKMLDGRYTELCKIEIWLYTCIKELRSLVFNFGTFWKLFKPLAYWTNVFSFGSAVQKFFTSWNDINRIGRLERRLKVRREVTVRQYRPDESPTGLESLLDTSNSVYIVSDSETSYVFVWKSIGDTLQEMSN